MDRLLSMELFIAVVEKGSFTAAAEAYSLSQPMVGKHIEALEARLGGKLLLRTTRRQRLTELGSVYFLRCKAILADIQSAEDDLVEMQQFPRGLLRINASGVFGSSCLAPLLADFMKTYPDINVQLVLNDDLMDPVANGYDVLFRVGHLQNLNMVARQLQPYRFVIAASPEYLAKNGTPQHPIDLSNHECLGFSNWRRGDGWEQLCRSYGVEPRVGRFDCNHGHALRELALAGFGLVLLAEPMLRSDITAGRLVEVLTSFLPESKPVHILYLPDKQLPKLKVFIDFMIARLGII